MSSVAISVENLSKRYLIGREKTGDGIRHVMERALRNPLAWFRERGTRSAQAEFWALQDLSFEVHAGDVIGIIGHNGSGKSTLLKILSRITPPTKGRVHIKGRVASLLEVGTGFHQELTGRENIYLNGAILGMTHAEIKRRFDEIVAFSEIAEFLDTPVKRYSSGMYVRLAFAIAAHLEPEILIVDEVLAVGDMAFQKKCLGKMGDVSQSGKTVLFVSHNVEAVRRLCHRGLLLSHGKLQNDASIEDALQSYHQSVGGDQAFSYDNAKHGLAIRSVVTKNGVGKATTSFAPDEDLCVEIAYEARQTIEKPYIALVVQGAQGSCFTANMLLDGHRPDALRGSGTIGCRFKAIPLLPQSYTIRMAIKEKNGKDSILDYHDVAHFSVSADLADYGYKGEFQNLASRSTAVVVPYEWNLPDGSVKPVALKRL